jgi:phosphoribosylformylglycinamidine synthase
MHAVAEAARNVSCTGATPVAATNCLNFGNPEKPQIMWQFSEVVDGLAEACTALGTPITGGNVSLYNETLGEGIYPTPVVGVVGIVDDIDRVCTPHFQAPGREIILLSTSGKKYDEVQLGSSEYARECLGGVWGEPPELDLAAESALQKCLLELIAAGHLESAHDCSDGGLAVAVVESCFRHEIGAELDLPDSSEFAEILLFGEKASRIVVSCVPGQRAIIQKMAEKYAIQADFLGRTGGDKLVIRRSASTLISAYIGDLKNVWVHALESALHSDVPDKLIPELLEK